MDGQNHYIRIDANNIVVKAFSDAFETPTANDILVESDAGRHYNPVLTNERGQFIYKWDGTQQVLRTQTELDAEWSARPPERKTELEIMRESAAQQSADFQAFMDDYYSKNPE